MTTKNDQDPSLDEHTMSLVAQDARLSTVETHVESLQIRMGALESKHRRVEKMVMDLQLENRRENKTIEGKLDKLLDLLQPKLTLPEPSEG